MSRRFLGVVVTTQYRPRTHVERWQLQDRLTLRLRRLGVAARPKFFEAPRGQLAFSLWLGLKPGATLLHSLETIDDLSGSASG